MWEELRVFLRGWARKWGLDWKDPPEEGPEPVTVYTLTVAGGAIGLLYPEYDVKTITMVAGADSAVIAREAADLAAGEQTDVTAHVRVSRADPGSVVWGHTSNLGSDPLSWEATATQVAASAASYELIAWGSRSPNTTYHFAVVTTENGRKFLSNVLSFATAYAAPTSPTQVATSVNSATVSWTDNSGGAAAHLMFVKEAADAASAYTLVGRIDAGQTVQFEFIGLTGGTQYSFAAAATDDADRLSTLSSINITI